MSSIAAIVDRLWPLFHKDPIAIFPAEIMGQIFSYLSPSMLLDASRASRAWRERVLDSGLWKQKFRTEGWGLNTEEVERFENNYNSWEKRSGKTSARGQLGKQKRPLRVGGKRTVGIKSSSIAQPQDNSSLASAQTQNQVEDTASDVGHPDQDSQGLEYDEEMLDVEANSPLLGSQEDCIPVETVSQGSPSMLEDETFQSRNLLANSNSNLSNNDRNSQLESEPCSGHNSEQSLMLYSPSGRPRLNYHFVYKQKRKLEENWNVGRYKNFQLPHRDHPADAHTECVYTLQYLGKHLVSGSRDRTLRIWDLDTQRLVREPLQGHTGSVLCLQFDDRQDEDIIISGSSDTHVILWRFSTGKMIKQLTNAHRESVLNLKFDKRFLVTCSKDKTIKIWNRHELRPGDRDYPVKGFPDGGHCPTYIIDMNTVGNARHNFDPTMLLEPYTHLMTLDLHGAAVNAIQIYKDQLVSASGDRNLRVWDIHTGKCTKKIEAHTKGIACVQYDGKRIVSGSSDNTIRIWDPVSKSEVARLEGHNRLVRTIQAAFADYPGGRENLEAEALEIDRSYQVASIAGLVPSDKSARIRQGKPGSRKPKDHRTVGAKLPPSGGGGRWGRIVSGSYDETIIIWKKTEEDEWVIGHRLRQEEALRAAGPPLIPRSDIQVQAQAAQLTYPTNNQPQNHASNSQPGVQAVGVHGPLPGHQIAQNATQAGLQQRPTLNPQPNNSSQPHGNVHHGWNNPALAHAYNRLMQQQQDRNVALQQGNQTPLAGPLHAAQSQSQVGNHQPSIPPANPSHAPRQPGAHPNHAPAAVGQPNARVFKLQFDARRIICCSQDPKIVGWDFADGDEHIAQCSRFFAAPQ